MQGRNFVAQDAAGNLVTTGSVVIRHHVSQALANVYASNSTGDPLTNPFSVPGDGKIFVYLPDGRYDITVESGDDEFAFEDEQFFDFSGVIASADLTPEVVVETGDSDGALTIGEEHRGRIVRFQPSGSGEITLPEGLTAPFAVVVVRDNAETVTFGVAGTQALRSVDDMVEIYAQDGLVVAVLYEDGVWALFGDLG